MEAVSERDKAIQRLVVFNNKKNSINKVSDHVEQPKVAITKIVKEEIIYQL